MTSTSETRGIFLMLLSIIFFTVNTLAVRAIALAFSACDGWEVTLFRGIAGSAVVIALIATMMINPRTSKTNSKKLTTHQTKR